MNYIATIPGYFLIETHITGWNVRSTFYVSRFEERPSIENRKSTRAIVHVDVNERIN